MYVIWDLYTDAGIGCETDYDLVQKWKKLNDGLRFDQLNMTGNDMYAIREFTGECVVTDYGTITPLTRVNYYTRRYRVTDEYGRTVDVRLLPETLWDLPKPKRDWSILYTGRKDHLRRNGGPSMRRRQLELSQEMPDMECCVPVSKRDLRTAGIRNKTVIRPGDAWAKYERNACRGCYRPKCWKN